MKILLRFLL